MRRLRTKGMRTLRVSMGETHRRLQRRDLTRRVGRMRRWRHQGTQSQEGEGVEGMAGSGSGQKRKRAGEEAAGEEEGDRRAPSRRASGVSTLDPEGVPYPRATGLAHGAPERLFQQGPKEGSQQSLPQGTPAEFLAGMETQLVYHSLGAGASQGLVLGLGVRARAGDLPRPELCRWFAAWG